MIPRPIQSPPVRSAPSKSTRASWGTAGDPSEWMRSLLLTLRSHRTVENDAMRARVGGRLSNSHTCCLDVGCVWPWMGTALVLSSERNPSFDSTWKRRRRSGEMPTARLHRRRMMDVLRMQRSRAYYRAACRSHDCPLDSKIEAHRNAWERFGRGTATSKGCCIRFGGRVDVASESTCETGVRIRLDRVFDVTGIKGTIVQVRDLFHFHDIPSVASSPVV